MKARPYQERALSQLWRSLKSHRRVMLQAPTGAGKTFLASQIAQAANEHDRRVLFLAPRKILIGQTDRSFYHSGLDDVSIIHREHDHRLDFGKLTQISTIQTLARRRVKFGSKVKPHVVIIDEAHEQFKYITEWMQEDKETMFIGLSATPWSKGLGLIYDDLVTVATTRELIDGGYLSDFEVYAPSAVDLKGVRTVRGDYEERELGKRFERLTADIADTYIKRARDRPTICFAVNRTHAAVLRAEFERRGVRSGYVDCFTSEEERSQLDRDFSRGDVEVVVNVNVLTTGVDWDVRCIILACSTKSEMKYVQMVGRGLRTAEGKDHCLILDHSDNTRRMGFVDEIIHDELSKDTKPINSSLPPERQPKACPKCGFVKPVGVHECPSCGFKPERVNKVEVQKGELKKLKRKKSRLDDNDLGFRQSFFSQLLGYAESKKFKKGWAAHKFREKFPGEDLPKRITWEPVRPTEEVLRWITSRNIAYAKSKKYSKRRGKQGG